MNTVDDAREYALHIMQLGNVPESQQEEVRSLLFLAYMRGWSDAAKGEMEFHRKLREKVA